MADRLEALLRARRENRPVPDQRHKVGPLFATWLERATKPTMRASTCKGYAEIVRLHLVPRLGRIPLAKLAPADVQRFLDRKLEPGLSPRRVRYLHAVLRQALVTAERWGMVSRQMASW